MSTIESLPMSRWSGVEGRPLIIAGPCSAESEAQMMESARRLQGVHVDYFRAGIWKARTRFAPAATTCWLALTPSATS